MRLNHKNRARHERRVIKSGLRNGGFLTVHKVGNGFQLSFGKLIIGTHERQKDALAHGQLNYGQTPKVKRKAA